MYFEKEAKESVLTLKYGNALLEILPEVGGCITRYCLETKKQTLELLRPLPHKLGLLLKIRWKWQVFH